MHTWPFPNIPPDLFETLSSDEKRLLEAITLLVLAEYVKKSGIRLQFRFCRVQISV
jgi:hypothetical protein